MTLQLVVIGFPLVIIGIIVVVGLIAMGLYNGLVRKRMNRENAFADIDVQMKQRYDLIPQLVSTVKGYAEHEKTVLEELTAARAGAMQANSIDDKIAADQKVSSALAGLKVSVEAYPDLKANENFLQLQGEISDIENKIAAARRFFNSATKELNVAIQSFPSNILAGMFGFKLGTMFEVPTEQRAAVETPPTISF